MTKFAIFQMRGTSPDCIDLDCFVGPDFFSNSCLTTMPHLSNFNDVYVSLYNILYVYNCYSCVIV